MGVAVCCDTPPKLTRDDQSLFSSSLSAVVATARTILPSDNTNGGASQTDTVRNNDTKPIVDVTLTSSPTTTMTTTDCDVDTTNNKVKSNNQKKNVRINDEVASIPLLTSASFFSKATSSTTDTLSSRSNDIVKKDSLWWTREERKEILLRNQRLSRDFKRHHSSQIQHAKKVYDEIIRQDKNNALLHNEDGDNDDDDSSDDEYDDIYNFFQQERSPKRRRTIAFNAASVGNNTVKTTSAKKRKRITTDLSPTGVEDTIPHTHKCTDTSSPIIDLPTHVRGLEWSVLPDAKRHRRTHARTVLRWQDRFRRRRQRRRIENEYSSSSSDGSNSNVFVNGECLTAGREQELLGHKATISSHRSCILAQVLASQKLRTFATGAGEMAVCQFSLAKQAAEH